MTREEFDALVFRLEQVARQRPRGYVTRVLLLALLGNVYIFAILLVLVAMLAGLVASVMALKTIATIAVKLIIVLGVFLWVVLKALWVSIPPPEGEEIGPDDAPELFAMIEALRKKLDAPRFHKVLIDNQLNAGVVQAPRLGVFGWHENYLMIGLPLMKSFTEAQFKAVLAHEFGHLAKGHGRVSNWIYRQRLRWTRLITALEQTESRGGFLFKPFLNWYGPYFNAYSFPLARANEYEADATSARLASPAAAAQALTSIDVIGSYLNERYWSQIYRQADEVAHPSFSPYASMGKSVATELDSTATQAWLQQALARSTTSDDTHPALTERLKAIGESPHLAQPEPGQAADRLLGAVLAHITDVFDRRWQENIKSSWSERHREVQEGRRQLAELDAKHDGGTALALQEAFDRAILTDRFGNDLDKAFAQLGELHQRYPDDPMICYNLATRMLDRDDDTGTGLVERAMRLDEDNLVRGAEALRDYHWRHGRKDEANAWHARAFQRSELVFAADKERNQVTIDDKFDVHGLTDDAVAALRTQLQAVTGLRKAYYVRKRVTHFPDRHCYVLGFNAWGILSLNRKKRTAKVMEQLREKVQFPGPTLVLSVQGANYRFGRRFRWMGGTQIL